MTLNELLVTTPSDLGTDADTFDVKAFNDALKAAWWPEGDVDADKARTLAEGVLAGHHGDWLAAARAARVEYLSSAPDLLLVPSRYKANIWVGKTHDVHIDAVLWDALTQTAEPVTVSGWYRSRVAGWVRVEWTNGRMRARAWASDQTAADRFVGITPTMRAILDAENDKDARR